MLALKSVETKFPNISVNPFEGLRGWCLTVWFGSVHHHTPLMWGVLLFTEALLCEQHHCGRHMVKSSFSFFSSCHKTVRREQSKATLCNIYRHLVVKLEMATISKAVHPPSSKTDLLKMKESNFSITQNTVLMFFISFSIWEKPPNVFSYFLPLHILCVLAPLLSMISISQMCTQKRSPIPHLNGALLLVFYCSNGAILPRRRTCCANVPYFPDYKSHFFHSLAGPTTYSQVWLVYQNLYNLTCF